jgi:hypothetical protein
MRVQSCGMGYCDIWKQEESRETWMAVELREHLQGLLLDAPPAAANQLHYSARNFITPAD